jgi:hypothetical protein
VVASDIRKLRVLVGSRGVVIGSKCHCDIRLGQAEHADQSRYLAKSYRAVALGQGRAHEYMTIKARSDIKTLCHCC